MDKEEINITEQKINADGDSRQIDLRVIIFCMGEL